MKQKTTNILFKLFLYLSISFLITVFSLKSLNSQLLKLNEIHIENEYLSDAMIICMQINALKPNENYDKTCVEIEEKISHNKEELESLYLAFFYLDYIKKD